MTTITWDTGTAYDLFISLLVLHQAGLFGLRPSWAAGVRQRLPAERRDFFERMYSFSGTGLEWVCSLVGPKDAVDILHTASNMDPAVLFEAVTLANDNSAEVRSSLHAIASRGKVTASDKETLKTHYRVRSQSLTPTKLDNLVNAWSDINTSGEQLLAGLKEYHEGFYAEEEKRLHPALERGLVQAREMAERMPVDELVETLSHGVRIEDLGSMQTLILAPSYWASPLAFHLRPKPDQTLLVFGVRSAVQSVVPGTGAPDLLVSALKSLADPTRLHILRMLANGPLTPAELARRLRLRPPTVIHHLQALRLAGLVQITITGQNERRYAARLERLNELNAAVQDYIRKKD
jgi:DNA-binding transcriptional ArsR family regulator